MIDNLTSIAVSKKHMVFYGWVIVVASFVMMIIQAGVYYTFGIFYKSLINEFHWSRTAISGILTTYWICHVIFVIPIGWISDRYGPRWILLICNFLATIGVALISRISSLWQIYIYFGLMVGCGFAGNYAILSATTARWFLKYRGLTLGIVASGMGLGTMIMAFLVQHLITRFGWRSAYSALSMMTFIFMVLPCFFILKEPSVLGCLPYGQASPKQENNKNTNLFPIGQDKYFTIGNIVRAAPFWIILSIFMLFFICTQMLMAHLYNYATDVGIQEPIAAAFISIIGGCSVIGRLGIGAISDIIGPRKGLALCLSLLIISFIIVIFAHEAWVFYMSVIIFGLAYGGEVPLVPGINSHFFGVKLLGFLVGSSMAAVSLGSAIGPLLGGIVFDYSGDYSMAFALAVGLGLVGILLTLRLRTCSIVI